MPQSIIYSFIAYSVTRVFNGAYVARTHSMGQSVCSVYLVHNNISIKILNYVDKAPYSIEFRREDITYLFYKAFMVFTLI